MTCDVLNKFADLNTADGACGHPCCWSEDIFQAELAVHVSSQLVVMTER